MTTAADVKSGKGSGDENFPVASALIAPRHRAIVHAYYRFARAADDIADNPKLPEAEKFRLLDGVEATLVGKSDSDGEALPLRQALAARSMEPVHALDLLKAFRQDVTKRRYETWDELMEYCRYSAMPVGRFVLDVHGEDRATWGPSDALCAALQVINHLQDCKKDYRDMDRVYIPLDSLAKHGARVEDVSAAKATPQLRACLNNLTLQTKDLMREAADLPSSCKDLRIAAETNVIVQLANRLTGLLLTRDPLSERVHLSKVQALAIAARASLGAVAGKLARGVTGTTPAKRAAR